MKIRMLLVVLGLSILPVLGSAESPPSPGTPPVLAAFGHVGLATADVIKATQWYKAVFGFEPLGHPIIIDTATSPLGEVARSLFGRDVKKLRIGQLRAAGVDIELFEFIEPRVQATADSRRAGYLHMAIIAADIEGIAQKVVASGGKIIVRGPPNSKRKVVFCSDPDGNVIEISSSKWDGM